MIGSTTRRAGLIFLLLFYSFLFTKPAHAQSPLDSLDRVQERPRPQLLLELPLLDIPFNTEHRFSFPSMHQANAITSGVTRGMHHLFATLWHPEVPDRTIKGIFENKRLGGLCASIVLFDAISPFRGWTHEEGHRAVLSRYGIASQDDIYKDPFAGLVSISHVQDEDLAWLKDSHPADMVRLASAGGEVQLELVFEMRKENFFGNRSSVYDLFDWWMNIGSLAYYVWLCGDNSANEIIEEETLKEDADILTRDIVGADYTTWVYDLFRPDEPYMSGLRGRPHPSGVGIDRYIQPSELTREELRYLRRQGKLIFLNFLSPQMFGFDRFRSRNPFTGADCWWNAALTHHLTPFGTATGMHLYYKQAETNLVVSYTNYLSRFKYWPGLSVELVRYPVRIHGKMLMVSTSVSTWVQPDAQRFESANAQAGGGFCFNVTSPFNDLLAWYIECDTKTTGWMPGIICLKSSLQARGGILVLL